MNILATQYTLKNKAFEIYVAGCMANPHCEGCHNPISWNFNNGEEYSSSYFSKIKNKIYDFNEIIDNIMIFGGEPLDQNYDELIILLKDLKIFNKPIWIFTRYEIQNIPNFVKEYCDYIKTGAYIPSLSCDNNIQYNITLATSNQHIYKKGIDY